MRTLSPTSRSIGPCEPTAPPDIVAQLRALIAKAPEGPYFFGEDEAEECGPHRGSGLSMVDTGRGSDWPIARLCESGSAQLIAKALTALPDLLTEIEKLRGDKIALERRIHWLRFAVRNAAGRFGLALAAGTDWLTTKGGASVSMSVGLGESNAALDDDGKSLVKGSVGGGEAVASPNSASAYADGVPE